MLTYYANHKLSIASASMVVCIISIIVCYWQFHGIESDTKKGVYAIIGILSARNNFDQRQAARESWLKYTKETNTSNKRIAYKFIVGSEGCDIPPEDRKDIFSCDWKPLLLTYPGDEILAYNIQTAGNAQKVRGSIGLDFEVNEAIIIKKLGITFIHNERERHQRLRISIFDRISKEEIVYGEFDLNETYVAAKKLLFKDVDHYMLPKEFKGSLVVDGFSNEVDVVETSGPCLINDGGGLISFEKVTRHGVITSFFPEDLIIRDSFCHFLPGSFVYTPFLEDRPIAATVLVKERMLQYETYQKKMSLENDQLKNEAANYEDILFVGMIDHYRNLPRKLLYFYSWAIESYHFKFTLKTDDDCFLNIPGILKGADEHKLEEKENVWYSQFRFNWQVDNFGKWAETVYTSMVYPAFGCGSGNMLSYNLAKWIAQNKQMLQFFQGEDVSIGIWLSAVAPLLVNDRRWSCFKSCHKDVFSLPDNNASQLKALFDNQVRNWPIREGEHRLVLFSGHRYARIGQCGNERENELFLSTQQRVFGFDEDRFQIF